MQPAVAVPQARKRRAKLPELDTTQVLMRINDDAASFKRYIFDEYESMGGIMVGEMCHFVDLACHILGKEHVKVYAEGWARMNMSIVLTFEDKSVCTILDSCNGSFDHPKELIEIYSNGMSMQLDHYLQLLVGGRDDVYKIDYPFSSDTYPEITEGEGTNLYINKVRERNRGISDTKVLLSRCQQGALQPARRLRGLHNFGRALAGGRARGLARHADCMQGEGVRKNRAARENLGGRV